MTCNQQETTNVEETRIIVHKRKSMTRLNDGGESILFSAQAHGSMFAFWECLMATQTHDVRLIWIVKVANGVEETLVLPFGR